MKRFLNTARAAACAALAALPAAAWAQTGYTTLVMEVGHRDRDVPVHIWYPTDATQPPETLGENAVFKGTTMQRDAAPRAGTHPLVVLSHGSGGNAANLGWIAGALAERGMIVAAPNHPGTTSGDSLQTQTVKIWERPADLTALIDLALADGLAGLHVDADAIAALGFSLGGYTVLGLAGAQVSKADYIAYCDANAGMMDCGWLAAGGVDFAQIDQARYEQSNLDTRLTAVVSVDPALSAAYTDASLARMHLPALLVNLGQGAAVPKAIDAGNLVGRMPDAQLHQVADAAHFSFLGLCKPAARALLLAIGEDPICTDPKARKRAEIHAELIQTTGDFLSRSFAKAN